MKNSFKLYWQMSRISLITLKAILFGNRHFFIKMYKIGWNTLLGRGLGTRTTPPVKCREKAFLAKRNERARCMLFSILPISSHWTVCMRTLECPHALPATLLLLMGLSHVYSIQSVADEIVIAHVYFLLKHGLIICLTQRANVQSMTVTRESLLLACKIRNA